MLLTQGLSVPGQPGGQRPATPRQKADSAGRTCASGAKVARPAAPPTGESAGKGHPHLLACGLHIPKSGPVVSQEQ
ncbi:MAG: hypothetical protein BIFFINMI_03044 [Phycisphaerae bacterium]|nr:hypothetical protein [Phycisphaerae bacterium]